MFKTAGRYRPGPPKAQLAARKSRLYDVLLMGLKQDRLSVKYIKLATRQAIDVNEANLVNANDSKYALAA